MIWAEKSSVLSKSTNKNLKQIDDYAKDGGQRRSDIYVVFTEILCCRDFCVW